jgi:hypothetical protein
MEALDIAIRFADNMIAHGTDRYGPVHSPMFAAVIDATTDTAPYLRSPDLPGQRVGDRSWFGTNLVYDIPLIAAFRALSRITGNDAYRTAVDDYLTFFCDTCPSKATGLFPWGEHAYWHHMYERAYWCGDRVYDTKEPELIHDHLRQAPAWFWDLIAQRDAQLVTSFGDGLMGHFKSETDFDFTRHALITEKRFSNGGFYFPRHAGFYILDWAKAYQYSRAERFLRRIDGVVTFFERRRSPANGLCRMDASERWDGHAASALAQTTSLALSLHEALEVLAQTDASVPAAWRSFADSLVESVAALLARSDPARTFELYDFETGEGVDPVRVMPLWFSSYGVRPLPFLVNLVLGLHRFTGRAEFLSYAEQSGRLVAGRPLPPAPDPVRRHDYSRCVPAGDVGSALAMFTELRQTSGVSEYQEMTLTLTDYIASNLVVNGWITGATGVRWYDGQMDPARVVYALVRLFDVAQGGRFAVPPDTQAR